MEIVQEPIGTQGNLDLSFASGKLVVKVAYNPDVGSVGLDLSLDLLSLVDLAEKTWPGKFPVEILEIVKLAIKGMQ